MKEKKKISKPSYIPLYCLSAGIFCEILLFALTVKFTFATWYVRRYLPCSAGICSSRTLYALAVVCVCVFLSTQQSLVSYMLVHVLIVYIHYACVCLNGLCKLICILICKSYSAVSV